MFKLDTHISRSVSATAKGLRGAPKRQLFLEHDLVGSKELKNCASKSVLVLMADFYFT